MRATDAANPYPIRGAPLGAEKKRYGRGSWGWVLLIALGTAILCAYCFAGGGGGAQPPGDHHAAEAVGSPALSSAGASAPVGASVPAADPGGQTGDTFGQCVSVAGPSGAGVEAGVVRIDPKLPSGKTGVCDVLFGFVLVRGSLGDDTCCVASCS